jgi:hypothetical protein
LALLRPGVSGVDDSQKMWQPEALLCPIELHIQTTESPVWIVTEEGLKKNPPGPTITVTVAALAIVGWKTRNGAMIATNTAMA